MVPIIFGPDSPPYIINHRYLACALHDEKHCTQDRPIPVRECPGQCPASGRDERCGVSAGLGRCRSAIMPTRYGTAPPSQRCHPSPGGSHRLMFSRGVTASGLISESDRMLWLFIITSFFSENLRPLFGSTRKGFGEGGSYRSTPDTTARVPFRALETGWHCQGAANLTVSQIVSKGRKQGTGSPAIQLRLFDRNLFPEGQESHLSKDVRKTSFYAL